MKPGQSIVQLIHFAGQDTARPATYNETWRCKQIAIGDRVGERA